MSATLVARGLAAGHGARALFSGLDLVVAPGDVVGLVGANGAGKSTALQLFAGLSVPEHGTVVRTPPQASRYVINVYVGSRRVDHKDQSYAPHGSVSATDVRGRAGQSFSLSGVVYAGTKNTLTFGLSCKIA